jgi:hypothetical protein
MAEIPQDALNALVTAVAERDALRAKLAAIRDRLKTAGVLTVNFAWRDELLALIDQEDDRD